MIDVTPGKILPGAFNSALILTASLDNSKSRLVIGFASCR